MDTKSNRAKMEIKITQIPFGMRYKENKYWSSRLLMLLLFHTLLPQIPQCQNTETVWVP